MHQPEFWVEWKAPFGSVVSVSCLESETDKEVCVHLHDHESHNGPSHKSSSSTGSLFYSAELVIMWNE